jgi:type III secretion system YscD/HrpQ family protein
MPGKLVAEDGLLKGLELLLPEQIAEERVIGRDPAQAQLVLSDPAAAPRQLRVWRSEEGVEVEVVEEAGSESPVLLNGATLATKHLLQVGDQLQVGGTLFRYTTQEEEEKSSLPTEQSEGNPAVHTPNADDDVPAQEGHSWEHDDIFTADEDDTVSHSAMRSSSEPTAASQDKERTMDTIFQETQDHNNAMLAEVSFDLLETGRWLLKVIGGPNNGAEFSLQTGNSYLIGTDPNSCDVIFHDTSVSRQHARITISDEDTLVIEDLRSRNGVLVEGRKIEGREQLDMNTVVTLGTTSFIIFDREGEMQTVISPMLPSIVKVLQQEDIASEEQPVVASPVEPPLEPPAPEIEAPKRSTAVGAFLITAAVTGALVLLGLGTVGLFRSAPVKVVNPIDYTGIIDTATKNAFPDVSYTFNQNTGRLYLIGHVASATDKDRLRYNLESLPFPTNFDIKNVIVDEYLVRDVNTILARNPSWRGVTIQNPQPGKFVLSGHLKTHDQSERLFEYIYANFTNLEGLQSNIIVEEDVLNTIQGMLAQAGLNDVRAQLEGTGVVFSGGVPAGRESAYQQIVEQIRAIPGVRTIKSMVSALPTEATLVNISNRYRVSGLSNQGGVNLTVIINGRILTRGDMLDGMLITSIKPNTVFLEKDGIKYRIDY